VRITTSKKTAIDAGTNQSRCSQQMHGDPEVTHYLLAATMALALMSGIAMAQTTSSESSTTSVVAPAVGTLSTSRTRRSIDGNGTETHSRQTTYKNDAGVADDVVITKSTNPPVNTSTSSTTTITR
jgi:hypothetical protein